MGLIVLTRVKLQAVMISVARSNSCSREVKVYNRKKVRDTMLLGIGQMNLMRIKNCRSLQYLMPSYAISR